MKEACAGKVVLPVIKVHQRTPKSTELVPNDSFIQAGADVLAVPTRELSEAEPTHVYLPNVDDPDLFFLIKSDQRDRLVIQACRGTLIRLRSKYSKKWSPLSNLYFCGF